jgi:hypothetical protein
MKPLLFLASKKCNFLKESLRVEAMYNIEARGRKIYHCKYTMLFWQGPVQKMRIIQKV